MEKLSNFRETLENFEETEELFRKFYAFTSGKSGIQFWCYKEFLKKLEIDKYNEMCQKFLVKYEPLAARILCAWRLGAYGAVLQLTTSQVARHAFGTPKDTGVELKV